MSEWFHNCLKTYNKACEIEWLSSNTRFRFTWMHTCEMAEKEKWEKIKDKMENITSVWFFLRWFQHDICMVLRNEEISCFIHKSIRV